MLKDCLKLFKKCDNVRKEGTEYSIPGHTSVTQPHSPGSVLHPPRGGSQPISPHIQSASPICYSLKPPRWVTAGLALQLLMGRSPRVPVFLKPRQILNLHFTCYISSTEPSHHSLFHLASGTPFLLVFFPNPRPFLLCLLLPALSLWPLIFRVLLKSLYVAFLYPHAFHWRIYFKQCLCMSNMQINSC